MARSPLQLCHLDGGRRVPWSSEGDVKAPSAFDGLKPGGDLADGGADGKS